MYKTWMVQKEKLEKGKKRAVSSCTRLFAVDSLLSKSDLWSDKQRINKKKKKDNDKEKETNNSKEFQ